MMMQQHSRTFLGQRSLFYFKINVLKAPRWKTLIVQSSLMVHFIVKTALYTVYWPFGLFLCHQIVALDIIVLLQAIICCFGAFTHKLSPTVPLSNNTTGTLSARM